MIFALKKFRPYLIGETFIVYSDHESVRSAFAKKDIHGSLDRWLSTMAEYESETRHKQGTSNATADYLSLIDPRLVDEPSHLLHEEVNENLAKDDTFALIDVLENGGPFKERLEQVRDYLTTVSSAGREKEYRRQAKAYVVSHGVLSRRQGKGLLVKTPIEARGKLLEACHDTAGPGNQ